MRPDRKSGTMDFLELITQNLTGTDDRFLLTMLVSMLPVIELRGGLPFGMGLGLSLPLASVAAILGNLLPIPFLILFTRRVMAWLRRHSRMLERLVHKIESRAAAKSELVVKYKFWGLLILVAVPLPGTGAWTGALVAAMMRLPLRRALWAIFLGVCTAAGIVAAVTLGLIAL